MKDEVHDMPVNNRLRMVPCRAGGAVILLLLIGLVVGGRPCSAGIPLVSSIEVTDITPASFAVSWQSSEPASGSLYLFMADCSTPIPNPTLSSEGNDRSGIVKVTVADLSANTAYCFQTATTSKSTSETIVYPATPVAVLTEKAVTRDMVVAGKSVPFANDLLRVPSPYLPAPADSQDGLLIVLSLLDGKGDKPLSLLLTADDTKNYFNLNNLFDPASGQSVNLTGGERVRITERHGNLGCTAINRFRTVPADLETTRGSSFNRCARSHDIDCDNKVNILDILRVARGTGSNNGDTCFNSDLDINGDGKVDQLDVDAVTGGFDATP
jgi:Dockerin type I domain